jgi:hypothetical protein
MVRQSLGFSAWMMMAVAALGCGGSSKTFESKGKDYPGVTADVAQKTCDDLFKTYTKASCVDDTSHSECSLCWQACGAECIPYGTCPETFECPEF